MAIALFTVVLYSFVLFDVFVFELYPPMSWDCFFTKAHAPALASTRIESGTLGRQGEEEEGDN